MDKQPEALLMAEVLKADGWPSVAAKLQQLHAENQGQAERIQDIYKQLNDTEKELDDLRLLLLQSLGCLEAFEGLDGNVDEVITAIKERLK